jgi:hypothetical protein
MLWDFSQLDFLNEFSVTWVQLRGGLLLLESAYERRRRMLAERKA